LEGLAGARFGLARRASRHHDRDLDLLDGACLLCGRELDLLRGIRGRADEARDRLKCRRHLEDLRGAEVDRLAARLGRHHGGVGRAAYISLA